MNQRLNLERNQAFIEELDYFLRCIAERRRPDVGIRDGAASVRMALALLASQAEGRVISLVNGTYR